jgi:GMP synthase-like glutamine amidotransferase
MNVHVLQHAVFDGIGSIAQWLDDRNAKTTWSHADLSWFVPRIEGLDLIIVLGGPMSVNDETEYPWIAGEKQFIREAIRQGVAVLGICLGSQLIASAMGAPVFPNTHREIGWFEIERAGPAEGVFQFPERMTVFHWHGETFDLPGGAVRLAGSAACRNQAFQIGPNVIGLQCHLEATAEGIESMISHCRDELVESAYVQSEETIRSIPSADFVRPNVQMVEILNYLTRTKVRRTGDEAFTPEAAK